jgi:hypothetical protein
VARHPRRHRLVHVLKPALLGVVAALAAPVLATAKPVDFDVGFGAGARLGESTSITVHLAVSLRLPPVTQFRLLTPGGMDLTSSGLGVASCRPPASEFAAVMNVVWRTEPCPRNSLMGTGSADAGLLLDPDAPIHGVAVLGLSAGPAVDGKPGLVVVADTYHPVRFHLTYQGYLYVPPPRFGVGVAIMIPQIPRLPFGAPIALSRLRLAVGGPGITYTKRSRGRAVRYHPRGIPLPERCPRHGFRFRLILRFADGSRRSVDHVLGCPRRGVGRQARKTLPIHAVAARRATATGSVARGV